MNMKTYSQMGSPIAESHVASIDYFESTTKTRWTKKRKIYIACILSIAAAIIVVAVVVPVMLTRRSRPSFSFAELYKPQGYNGTGINGLLEGTWHNRTHDRLVV